MVKVGDRIEIESEKVGQPPRQGLVIGQKGHLLTIRWEDGRESSFMPTAGSLRLAATPGEGPSSHN